MTLFMVLCALSSLLFLSEIEGRQYHYTNYSSYNHSSEVRFPPDEANYNSSSDNPYGYIAFDHAGNYTPSFTPSFITPDTFDEINLALQSLSKCVQNFSLHLYSILSASTKWPIPRFHLEGPYDHLSLYNRNKTTKSYYTTPYPGAYSTNYLKDAPENKGGVSSKRYYATATTPRKSITSSRKLTTTTPTTTTISATTIDPIRIQKCKESGGKMVEKMCLIIFMGNEEKKNYEGAQRQCKDSGGKLFMPDLDNNSLNKKFSHAFKGHDYYQLLIDLRYNLDKLQYLTSTGFRVRDDNRRWGRSEPWTTDGEKSNDFDCVMLSFSPHTYELWTTLCRVKKDFACEINVS